MKQLGRRITYLLLGVMPATCLLLVLPQLATALVLAAFLGIVGLLSATVMRFPVTNFSSYVTVAITLCCGLAAIARPSAVAVSEIALGALGGQESFLAEPLLISSALLLWLFVGPPAVALHFLAISRRTPNNSFKPKPLRGSA